LKGESDEEKSMSGNQDIKLGEVVFYCLLALVGVLFSIVVYFVQRLLAELRDFRTDIYGRVNTDGNRITAIEAKCEERHKK
jgi:hypothetical protein